MTLFRGDAAPKAHSPVHPDLETWHIAVTPLPNQLPRPTSLQLHTQKSKKAGTAKLFNKCVQQRTAPLPHAAGPHGSHPAKLPGGGRHSRNLKFPSC